MPQTKKPIRAFTPDLDPSLLKGSTPLVDYDFSLAPTDLELGAGTGMFAIDYALKNPQRQIIAIEQTKNKFAKFDNKLKDSPVKNLTAIRADATLWVPQFLPDASIDQCYILYPNPYPKTKSSNLRWHNMPFMHVLLQKLKPSGRIMVATNTQWLHEEALVQFAQQWKLHILENKTIKASQHIGRTLFEKKYLERGETCFELTAQKKGFIEIGH